MKMLKKKKKGSGMEIEIPRNGLFRPERMLGRKGQKERKTPLKTFNDKSYKMSYNDKKPDTTVFFFFLILLLRYYSYWIKWFRGQESYNDIDRIINWVAIIST